MGTYTGGIRRAPRADTTSPGGRRAGRTAPIPLSPAAAAHLTSPEGAEDAEPLASPETHGAARLRARAMLAENRHVVEALRDALLDRHELIGEEILDVIQGAVARSGAEAAGVEPQRG